MDEINFIDQTIDDIKRGIQEKNKEKHCIEFEGSLYEELKYRCSPERYMEPYNPEKIDLAADLYAEVLKCDEYGDKKTQVELRKKASTTLSVKFSTRRLYEKLREHCDPKNFINQENYDAEKVKLANKYYQKINECCDDIDALETLEMEIKNLFQTQSTSSESSNSELSDGEAFTIVGICVFLIILVLICIVSYYS